MDALMRAEGYAKFGKRAVAAGVISAHRKILPWIVAPKCVTATCSEPANGDDVWCASCGRTDPEPSPLDDTIEADETTPGLEVRRGW
jgi:hypothetical protein